MNILRLFGLLFLILFLSSCPNLPRKDFGPVKCSDEAIYLGKIKLDHNSLEYFPYEEFNSRKSIYFINAKKEEIKFSRPLRTRPHRNFVRRVFDITCEDGSLNICQSDNEWYSVFYECDELEIDLYATLKTIHRRKLQFIDKLELRMQNREDRGTSYLKIVTSSKIIQEKSERIFGYQENYEFLTDLDTLDKVFIDVFKSTNSRRRIDEIYYTTDLGIVAFNDTLSGFWIHEGME